MNSTVTDPVCGMTIDPTEAAASSTYGGKTYHFCARACETKFNVAPATYAADPESCCTPDATAACCTAAQSCC